MATIGEHPHSDRYHRSQGSPADVDQDFELGDVDQDRRLARPALTVELDAIATRSPASTRT